MTRGQRRRRSTDDAHEMPTVQRAEDEEDVEPESDNYDYRELRQRATEALVRIKTKLLIHGHDRSFIAAMVENYDVSELAIYREKNNDQERRDHELFYAYVTLVLEPVYLKVHEDVRNAVKVEVEELIGHKKPPPPLAPPTPPPRPKRPANIQTQTTRAEREEDNATDYSLGYEVLPIAESSPTFASTSTGDTDIISEKRLTIRAPRVPNDVNPPPADAVDKPPTVPPPTDSSEQSTTLPDSLRRAALKTRRRRRLSLGDAPMGFISGPDEGHFLAPVSPKDPVGPANLGITRAGTSPQPAQLESLLADYEEIAYLSERRQQAIETSPEDRLSLPLYRVRAEFTATEDWQLSLDVDELVEVVAMTRPQAEGMAAWWMVEKMYEERSGTGSLGWVSSAILMEHTGNGDQGYGAGGATRRDSAEAPEALEGSRPETLRSQQPLYRPSVYNQAYPWAQSDPSTQQDPWAQGMYEGEEEMGLSRRHHNILERLFRKLQFGVFNFMTIAQKDKPMQTFSLYTDAVELEAVEVTLRPFATHAPRKTEFQPTFTVSTVQTAMTKVLFGERLCNPQYCGLSYAYFSQLNDRTSQAIRDSKIVVSQTEWLVTLLQLVALRMSADESMKKFVSKWGSLTMFGKTRPDVVDIMDEPIPADAADADADTDEPDDDDAARIIKEAAPPSTHLAATNDAQRAHELLTFILECWLMVPLNLSTIPIASVHPLTTSPISTLISPQLPQPSDPDALAHSARQLLVTTEMSAAMLHDWKNLSFVWTSQISEHLSHDAVSGAIKIYGEVSFVLLHALAGNDGSSLSKREFTHYHSLLLEVAHTYRMLFGPDPPSRLLFSQLDVKNRCAGYFDMFEDLPLCDTQPRMQYVLAKDFPVFGERLVQLRILLRPTGLRSLWKDKRDSLQWYTFWAVVLVGVTGIFLALVQVALGTVQAWASVQALKGHKRSYPPPPPRWWR